ncbi:MAG: gamma carbonic anhydrase family protein [Sulfuriferula sp.]
MLTAPTNISSYLKHYPDIADSSWVHHSANIIGNVNIGAHTSIWCGVVIRGDVNKIDIGHHTNIQDLSVLHVSHPTIDNTNGSPLSIGNYVTVGHNVILHGCCIQDECLIGMGSLIMDDVIVEKNVIVGAGSLVSEGKILESGFLYLGRPAKCIRALTDSELAYFKKSADYYVALAQNYNIQSD